MRNNQSHSILLALVCSLLCTIHATGQQDSTSQYLLGSPTHISGFGGMLFEVSALGDATITSFGGGGGLLLSRHLFFGGYGIGTLNEVRRTDGVDERVLTSWGHGGVWLGYQFLPSKMVQPGVSVRAGGGTINIKDQDGQKLADDDVMVFQPELKVDVLLMPWMKFRAGVGYRWVTGATNAAVSNDDLQQPFGTVGLFFGWFE